MAMSSSPVLSTSTTASGVGGGLGEVGRGVRDGDADVGDRDRDVLGVGGGAVGGPDGQRVAGGRLEVEVVRVVDGDRAGARADGERQVAVVVAVGVAGGDRPGEAVVVAGRGDGDHGGAVGGGLGEVGRGVGDRRRDVGDRDRDVLGVGGRAVGGLDGEVVARGRLEVEVVGVVDGDRARARVDGERQVAVAVPVGVAGGDRPGEALVVAGRGDGDDRGAVGGGLGEVGRGVRDGRRDVGDRDGDDLGVGRGAVGGLDREVVAGGRLEVEVVRVVDGDRAGAASMANGRLPSLSPSVLPAVMDQVRPSSSPVVETVTTAALSAAVSARLAEVSATVGATSVIVIVMSSVSGVVPSVALTVSV